MGVEHGRTGYNATGMMVGVASIQVRIIQMEIMGVPWEFHGKLGVYYLSNISSHLFFGIKQIEATLEDGAFDGL